MKRSLCVPVFLVLLVFLPRFAVAAAATQPCSTEKADQKTPFCSTEKVNHEDCKVRFNRRYPVTLPTVQMSPGKCVFVEVVDPLDFETISLDETGATALPGTDQLAGFLTSAIPNLKGLVWSNVTNPAPAPGFKASFVSPSGATPEQVAQMDLVKAELDVLQGLLDTAQSDLEKTLKDTHLFDNIRAVYEQLNQAMAPIPKPGSSVPQKPESSAAQKPDSEATPKKPGPGTPPPYTHPPDAPQTPNPWTDYANWRSVVLCELVGNVDGTECAVGPNATDPAFTNVLGTIGALQARLPTVTPASPPNDPIFDQTTFDALVKRTKADIAKVTDPAVVAEDTANLGKIKDEENSLTSRIAVLGNTLTNVQKDFLTYYQNVLLATHAVPAPKAEGDKPNAPMVATIGTIYDPQSNQGSDMPFRYAKFLGRQVVFSVNAVNNLTTAVTSITASTARVSIATVTVLYADPKLEASAGAMVSFVHNRSFVNQTITNPPAGSNLVAGDIVIAQTKTDPEVVPFVALHYRLGDDFVVLHRRAAWYGTGWVGLNPYSTVPEYGGGPTFSWRSIMLSFLYNRAHQTALLAGETANEVVCSPNATAGATPPPCTPAPPAPVTKTVGLNAFAIGLSVRIPTSFAAGTGGVSR